MAKYIQGTYKVKNKEKYVGTNNPRYLSSYELEVFRWMDMHPHILEWGSECIIVKYYNPIKQRYARYIVDIYCKYKTKNGKIIKELIEIKPHKDLTKPRKTSKKKQETFLREVATYETNMAKWKAASKYAEDRKMRFRIITEKNIYV